MAHAQTDAVADRADRRAVDLGGPAQTIPSLRGRAALGPRWQPVGVRPALTHEGRVTQPPGRRVATCADAKRDGARLWGGVGFLLGATAALVTPTSREWQTYALLGVPAGVGALLGYRAGARSRACTGA